MKQLTLITDMDLTSFKNLIRERCGLCFEDVRTETLTDSIRSRMSKRNISEPAKYFDCIAFDSDEFHELVNLVTINETYFFRETVHIEMLSKRLIPNLLSTKKTGEKVRILSAGCSTGEEPYSIAMSIMEHHEKILDFFLVIGTDIDSDALNKADSGFFSRYSFRNFPEELKEKYFTAADSFQWKIKRSVRERVEFRKLNLQSDAYPAALQGIDVIFYRNVSIYFEPDTQKSIFRKLAGLLNNNGYLIVSATETMSHNFGVLSLVELDGMFLYQKGSGVGFGDKKGQMNVIENSVRLAPERAKWGFEKGRQQGLREAAYPSYRISSPSVGTQTAERIKGAPALFEEALSHARNKEYDKSLALIDEIMRHEPSFIKAYTLRAGILINLKRLQEAEDICLKSIDIDKWCLESYLLLGLIARIQNGDEKAVKRFKEALYIQSSCWLAHFYLADIFRSQGKTERAIREYEITLKLLKKENIQEHGLTFFMLAFPVKQIAHLCNHNIEDLKRRFK